jgi:hypothetical protein
VTTSTPSSRQRWLVPVVVVVLSVTVGAGLLARELYRSPDQPADDPTAPVSASSASSGEPAAPDDVRMTADALSHPQAEAVRTLLRGYFAAINDKQYGQWTNVVSAHRLSQQTPADWRSGVRSTEDSEAVVYRIERGSGVTLRVLVGFKSVQDLADAPDFFHEACIRWRLVLPVIVEKSTLKIDTVDGGPPPEHQKC